jgi:hypothetical protein
MKLKLWRDVSIEIRTTGGDPADKGKTRLALLIAAAWLAAIYLIARILELGSP